MRKHKYGGTKSECLTNKCCCKKKKSRVLNIETKRRIVYFKFVTSSMEEKTKNEKIRKHKNEGIKPERFTNDCYYKKKKSEVLNLKMKRGT